MPAHRSGDRRAAPVDSALTVERNRHGRQEHRLVETFDVTGRLGPDWNGLIVAAARVTRLTWHKDTATGLWQPTQETAFHASQINLSATAIGAAIRQHWGIESVPQRHTERSSP